MAFTLFTRNLLFLTLWLVPSVVLAEQQVIAEFHRDETLTRIEHEVETVEPIRWTVVVASLTERTAADTTAHHFSAQLEQRGYPVAVITEDGGNTYRVIVGRFPKLVTAQASQAALGDVLPASSWLFNVQAQIPESAWLSYPLEAPALTIEETRSEPKLTPGDEKPESGSTYSIEAKPLVETTVKPIIKPTPAVSYAVNLATYSDVPVRLQAPLLSMAPRPLELHTTRADAALREDIIPVVEVPTLPEVYTEPEAYTKPEIAPRVKAEPKVDIIPTVDVPTVPEANAAQDVVPRVDAENVRWTMAVASFSERFPADTAATFYHSLLQPRGYPVAVLSEDEGQTYRVIVGRFEDLATAQAAQDGLEEDLPTTTWLMYVQEEIPETAWLQKPGLPEEVVVAPTMMPEQSITLGQNEIILPQAYWTVVVSSYTESKVADAAAMHFRNQLGAEGYHINVISGVVQGAPKYHIAVGRFEQLRDAEAGLLALDSEVPAGSWLLKVQPEAPDVAWSMYVQAVVGNATLEDIQRRREESQQVDIPTEPIGPRTTSAANGLAEVDVVEDGVQDEEPSASDRDDIEHTAFGEGGALTSQQDVTSERETPVEQKPVRWTMAMATYSDKASADTAAIYYQGLLHPHPVAVIVEEGSGAYRVVVGRFEELSAAQRAENSLAHELPSTAWLMYVQHPVPEQAWLMEPEERIQSHVAVVDRIEPQKEAEARLDEERVQEGGGSQSAVHGDRKALEPTTSIAEFDRSLARWTVILESFPDRASADATAGRYSAELQQHGYPVAVLTEGVPGNATYRVVVGQFERLAGAQEGQQALGIDIPSSAWLLYVQ